MEVITSALKASVATAEKKVRRHQIQCNLNLFFKYAETNNITAVLEGNEMCFFFTLCLIAWLLSWKAPAY